MNKMKNLQVIKGLKMKGWYGKLLQIVDLFTVHGISSHCHPKTGHQMFGALRWVIEYLKLNSVYMQ